MKYVFEFDTSTKQLTARRDGVEVPNVSSVSVNKYTPYSRDDEEENYVHITQETKNDDGSRTCITESTQAAVIESISTALMGE